MIVVRVHKSIAIFAQISIVAPARASIRAPKEIVGILKRICEANISIRALPPMSKELWAPERTEWPRFTVSADLTADRTGV